MGIRKLWREDLLYYSSLDFEDIKFLCGSFYFISFVSLHLQCNRVALVLANVAKENEGVTIWSKECPSFLFPVI